MKPRQSLFWISLLTSLTYGALPAAADTCTDLSNLVLPEVTSITATSVPPNAFSLPPPFPGLPPGPPVPVAFCRVQITVAPAINIEVWLPPAANWNHRFQAEGGGGYAGSISYSALAMAVAGDAETGQFATASTDTGHPATGTANGQGGANMYFEVRWVMSVKPAPLAVTRMRSWPGPGGSSGSSTICS